VVLAIGHALRAHEALSRPDALSGFLEVVHSFFEDGVFIGHEKSIRAGSILRSLDCFAFSGENAYERRKVADRVPGYVLGSSGPGLCRAVAHLLLRTAAHPVLDIDLPTNLVVDNETLVPGLLALP
jgi:hypothetical protein